MLTVVRLPLAIVTFNSERTKIKNIELGKQRVSDDDLKRIAQCLDAPPAHLQPSSENKKISSTQIIDGILISQKVVDMFPDLGEYLEMIEKASRIYDLELIEYISKKLADIWRTGPKLVVQPVKRITETT